ncbi:DUF803-domain-containing protein [Sodiomyces alkalinus F11]|uniref:DUF803-domain-containing protein n=1 Tax=Sodiomyces alkalinus (strain CBS 110278 / VKM F-3762 / F11) TaxID=1314773 RepID=A0A3N2PWB0_SODAK|nr:DUF803-domain-containing protein [Sodiomyces alkalinus F11]ROT38809.1 DUF803-domain-containing protein [Sodiomyces alkalinus F11]
MGEPSSYPAFNDIVAIRSEHPDHGGDGELRNWSSLIGIVTAIVGNVLIALALNVQRYAHLRLHRERVRIRRRAKEAFRRLENNNRSSGVYGSLGRENGHRGSNAEDRPHNNRAAAADGNNNVDDDDEYEYAHESDLLTRSFRSEDSAGSDTSDEQAKASSSYLKSPYWWTGQILITLGELGNFLAYGFAPASIVSPLGVVALISNCIIAPIFFKEIFRQRDFWGVVIAVGGVVTVVLSANQEETKLDPNDVWRHIKTIEFEVYLAVTISLIAILMWASSRYGTRTILIDLGLVGLFGGYTALATKGVSSMLSSTLWRTFTTPVAYVLIFILIMTAIMQIRYLNKALQRFDSTQVIPTQFVTFTLCVIVGSAVLYRDFERTSATQAAKFVGGCLLTFFGVFLITSGRPDHDDEEHRLSDVPGIEETIGLAHQDTNQPSSRSTASGGPTRSRGSSKASRPDPFLGDPQPYAMGRGFEASSYPRARTHRHGSLGSQESAPLLSKPWTASLADHQVAPPPGVRTISDDSATTLSGLAAAQSAPSSPPRSSQYLPARPGETPTTPRASLSLPAQAPRTPTHHFSGTIFSPSPLSSTVNAVVKDTLLRDTDHPYLRRPSVRRLRSGIRASLFIPDDDGQNYDVGTRSDERRRPAARSHGCLDETAHEPSREGQTESPFDGRTRPRSLSDTLGELFKLKRKPKSRHEDPA